MYYRNKIYTEEEREKLWLEKLDKEERWVCGEKVSIKGNEYEEYNKLRDWYREKSKRLGYGNGEMKWSLKGIGAGYMKRSDWQNAPLHLLERCTQQFVLVH